MVRSHTVLVWSHLLPKKSLLVVVVVVVIVMVLDEWTWRVGDQQEVD